MEGNKKIIYINDWETTNTNTTTTTQENFDIEQEVLEETGTYQSMPKRDIMMEAKRPVSFEGQEVDPMSDYVSKDAFEAHMRRIDDRVSSMETLLVERMGSMEERLNIKFDRLVNSIETLSSEQKGTQKEIQDIAKKTNQNNSCTLKKIHEDNNRIFDSNRQVLWAAMIGFIGVWVALFIGYMVK